MLEALMQTYARLPVTFERGEGAWLTDSEGEHYLDALSGIGVCDLIDVTAQSVIRLLPPLIIADKEAQQITHTVIDLVTHFLANSDATRRG